MDSCWQWCFEGCPCEGSALSTPVGVEGAAEGSLLVVQGVVAGVQPPFPVLGGVREPIAQGLPQAFVGASLVGD